MNSLKKIYNVVLNSNNKTSGTNSNANYYIDWSAVMPSGKYYLHFNYMGSANTYVGNKNAQLLISGLSTHVHTSGQGAPTTQYIGMLKPIVLIAGSTNTALLFAEDNTSAPIYLENRPLNNNFNVQVLDNFGNPFTDNAIAGAGTASYVTGTGVLTVATQTASTIIIGTVLTIGGNSYTILSYGTGIGGVGTYNCATGLTNVATATAYTSPAGNPPAPYILNLAFEEINIESS